MPYVGEDAQTFRKRRWDDDDEDLYSVYGPEKQPEIFLVNQHPSCFAPRKMAPLSKRARMLTDDSKHAYDDLESIHRRKLLLKEPAQEHYGRPQPRPANLQPCHICLRHPTKKSDLDSFAECLGCGERTCFVCIRQCPGWGAANIPAPSEEDDEALSRSFHMDDIDDVLISRRNDPQDHEPPRSIHRDAISDETPHDGTSQKVKAGWSTGGHRMMICSRCCVEKGAEGEVMCLGCLSRTEAA
jgi:hypothetical protein